MQLGKINKLTIKRFAPPGAYLIDLQENEVLLPNKYLTPDIEEGTEVEVFVMKDSSERLVSVTERPLHSTWRLRLSRCSRSKYVRCICRLGSR